MNLLAKCKLTVSRFERPCSCPESVFERIPNNGPNQILKYYLQEQVDQIEYQIIQTLLFE